MLTTARVMYTPLLKRSLLQITMHLFGTRYDAPDAESVDKRRQTDILVSSSGDTYGIGVQLASHRATYRDRYHVALPATGVVCG